MVSDKPEAHIVSVLRLWYNESKSAWDKSIEDIKHT